MCSSDLYLLSVIPDIGDSAGGSNFLGLAPFARVGRSGGLLWVGRLGALVHGASKITQHASFLRRDAGRIRQRSRMVIAE